MNEELAELYQQVVIDHSKRPRNCRVIEGATSHAEGFNALCGDRLTVYLKLDEQGQVSDISFVGAGCAICTATASMMTQGLKGKTRQEVEHLFHVFHDLLTGQGDPDQAMAELGKLAALAGVRRFPVRVKCATLPWHTMKAALDNRGEDVSTE